MPAYLEKSGYKNLTDSHHTVWQDGWKTKDDCFQWMMSHPKNFENFNLYMASRRQNQVTWLDFYQLSISDLNPERALFVDVGGGIGHSCAEFKVKYPELPGRVILQDLPYAIEHALPTPNVENTAHDFMMPQPVQGKLFSSPSLETKPI